MEVPLGKMDMAKAKLLEPQRQSVMLAVASPAIGAMGSNTVVPSGANGGLSAQEPGLSNTPSSGPNRSALQTNTRTRGLRSSDKCVNSYRRSRRKWITRFVREGSFDGRVPIVAMKRGNARGAKGNRILGESVNQREGKTSHDRDPSTSPTGTTGQG